MVVPSSSSSSSSVEKLQSTAGSRDGPPPSGSNRKPGGLVSRRVQMYEAPLSGARKGYAHRPQDSFYVKGQRNETEEAESRDESPSRIDKSQSRRTTIVTRNTSNKTTVITPTDYAGSSLIESGVNHYAKGEYEKAHKAFSTALKTQRVSVGDDDVSIALTLGNLGSVYLQQNKLDDANRVLTEALEIKRRVSPNMVIADTLNNLGNCANIQGDYEKSLAFYQEALADVREKNGPRDDEANALFNIGRLEVQRCQWTSAMKHLNEACCMAREIYGTNHPFVAQSLDLMGFVQLSTGGYDSAMVSFTGALAIYRRLHGPMHSEVANSLFNVGMVREAKGDLADAWEAYTTSRDLYLRLGTNHDHPGYTTVRRSIANAEKAIAKQNQAKQQTESGEKTTKSMQQQKGTQQV